MRLSAKTRLFVVAALLASSALSAQVPKPAEEPKAKPESAPPAQSPEEGKSTVSAGAEGFVIQSASGDSRLQIRGYVQFDGRFFPNDPQPLGIDQFLLRRVRPIVQGTVAKYFEFSIVTDFGVGATVLQDAYLDVNASRKIRVRVGKFKAPVGLERLQPATALSLVERAFPTAVVPNRDVGIELHGELARGMVAYAVGLFDGAPDGGSVDTDSNSGKDVDGRVFLSPFRNKKGSPFLKGLSFGIAGTTGKQTGPLPAYRSDGQVSIFTLLAGITADGTRNRFSPQLSLYSGPLGLMAEYAQSESWVKKPASTSAPETRVQLTAKAWEATVTLTLTGEAASYSALRPKKPFDPGERRWGALELAARVQGLEVGSEALAAGLVDPTKSVRKAFGWTVGLNWYLNRNIKQVVNYERTTFAGGASDSADRPAENALLIRTQVAF